jgi:hypothetical protein
MQCGFPIETALIDANEIEVMGAGSPADSYASEDIVKFSESEMPDELIGEDEIPF